MSTEGSILDRILHHAQAIAIRGPSYRDKVSAVIDAKTNEAETEPTESVQLIEECLVPSTALLDASERHQIANLIYASDGRRTFRPF